MTGEYYKDEDVYKWTDLLNFDYPLSSIKKRNYEINGAVVLGAGSYGTVIKSPYTSPFHLHKEDKHKIVVALKIISKEPPKDDLKKEAEHKINRGIQDKKLRGGNKVKQTEAKEEDVKNKTIELHRLRVRNEIAILGNINSVKAHSAVFYESFESKKCFYISTELLSGGPIWERLVTLSPFTEEHIIRTIRPIIKGLRYLHGKEEIVHRDIRLSNLIFRSPDPDNFDVVIIDYGFAQYYKNTPKEIGLPTAGKYMAPEVIKELIQGKTVKPKPREDMWAVGVIAYKFLTGIYPFLTMKQNEEFNEIDAKYCKTVMEKDYRIDSVRDRYDRTSNRADNNKTENHLEGVSEEAKEFVQGLLHKSIRERWTAERADGYTWLGPEFTPPNRDLPGLREDYRRHRGRVERERPSRGNEAADVDVSLRQTQSRTGTGEDAIPERPKQKRSRLSFRNLLYGRKKKDEEQEVHEVLTRSGSHNDHGQSAVSKSRKKNERAIRKAVLTTWEEPKPQHHLPNSFNRDDHNITGRHVSDMNDAPSGS